MGAIRALNIMAPMCFRLCLIFASLLLFLALPSSTSPTTPEIQLSAVTSNSTPNAIVPHCYIPEGRDTPGIHATDLEACKDALAVLVRTPNFMTRFRFSRNPRAMAIEIPTGWQMGTVSDCRILVNCQNDRDTGVFRYADVAQIARRIIENCVDQPDPYGRHPLLRWGGVDGIEGTETFYVAVARPLRAAPEVEVANVTVIASGGLIDVGIESS